MFEDAGRKVGSVPKGIDHIPEIPWGIETQARRNRGNFLSFEIEDAIAGLEMGAENRLYDLRISVGGGNWIVLVPVNRRATRAKPPLREAVRP